MATYPEDEIEEEEHVFDAFRAAFHAHGVGFWRMFLKPVNEEVSRWSSRYAVLALTELNSGLRGSCCLDSIDVKKNGQHPVSSPLESPPKHGRITA